MRYISTFSGIEAASVAWAPLGWEPIAFSEIDPFPSAVLAERFPDVPNLGDITKVDWKRYRGKVDVLVGGSPCQSFSVAGKREGLQGASGLMWEFIRAVREVRPRWFLWENVPGALTSERGKAFGTLLYELAVRGGYGCSWRVLDAQFFGVAQRRRRVFLVGRLGDGFREACQVLFEPDFLPGNSSASKAERARLAARAGRGVGAAGFIANASPGAGQIGYADECGAPIRTHELSSAVMVAANQRGELRVENGDGQVSGAIPASQSGKQFQGVLCMASGQAHAEINEELAARLAARQYKDPPITMVTRCGKPGGGKGALLSEDVSLTVSTRNEQSLFDPQEREYVVRRLTPVECERLMGFPDDWTRIPWRGHPASECPDGPRYKAIGNSMCTNVMRWIGKRIEEVDATC